MIFSEEKWNNGDELREFVKVSAALSFKMMCTPLRNAWYLFLVPLLGEAMAKRVTDIYGAEEREDKDAELLKMCQACVANLAFWYEFDNISVRITDAGFQRQQSDTGSFSPAYKYQEDNLRRGFKAKGFNWLDRILDFLTANIERYEEFRKSDAYEDRVSAIVRSTKDVDDVYFINSSRLVFLRLKVHIGFVEEMTLRPEIGENLYKTLKDGLKEGTADEKIERLRVACSKYVAALAVMRLLRQTGSITDRGLYFTSLLSGKEGNMEVKPVDDNRLRLELDGLKEAADAYRVSLMRLIRNEWSDMYAGDAGRVMDMDNDGRIIFWA